MTGKITGLGGVFFVSKDTEASRKWYREVLGIDGPYGPQLLWSAETGEQPYSLLSMFSDTSYMQPGTANFMINFRVDDLDSFVGGLREKGIEILGEADEGYGKFAWVLDPDGIKIELWQQCSPPE